MIKYGLELKKNDYNITFREKHFGVKNSPKKDVDRNIFPFNLSIKEFLPFL